MPRFFIDDNQINGSSVTLTGDNAAHIGYSLRMRIGEKITVCTPDAIAHLCEITSISADTVEAKILSSEASGSEPPYFARLFMALPKGDKMEYVIQKSVECGVSQIIPFESERTIVRLDAKSAEKKRERYQKIAEAAASQCGRGIIPEVTMPLRYREAIAMAARSPLAFMCWEDEKAVSLPALIKGAPDRSDISFIVGAEGGISKSEAEEAKALGIKTVTLGERILRCESAPPFVLAFLSCILDID